MEGNAATDLPYKIQVSLNPKYRSLIVRGRLIHEQTSRSMFPEKRKAGDSNLDLWLDGRIYPVDPSTGKRPRFHDVKSILEFVGDGENGLLGYTCSLQNSNTEVSRRVVVDREKSDNEIAALRKSLEALQQREQQLKSRQLVESESLQREIQGLQDQNVAIERSSNTMITSLREEIRIVTKELEESIQAEVERETEIEAIEREQVEKTRNLVESHRSELERVKRDFDQTSKALAVLERKWQKVQSTPYGYRKQSRARRDLHNLSQSGGHAKAQRRLARSIVAPATVRAVQEGNVVNQTKQRLCGSLETQLESGKVFASIMSKREVSTMLQMPAMESIGTDIANQYLNKIGAEIRAHKILAVEYRSGITNEAYSEIYKKFVGGVKSAGKGIRIGCLLPKPYHVSLLRKEMNAKLADFVGEYYPIINTLEIPPAPRSKKKESMLIELNEHNSLFVDVETVQKTMVQLYKFTPAGMFNFHSSLFFPLSFLARMN